MAVEDVLTKKIASDIAMQFFRSYFLFDAVASIHLFSYNVLFTSSSSNASIMSPARRSL
jgi:hypothetical protein